MEGANELRGGESPEVAGGTAKDTRRGNDALHERGEVGSEGFWGSLHEHLHTALQKGHSGGEDENGDHKGANRVSAMPSELPDQNRGYDHADAAKRVCDDVQEDTGEVVGVVSTVVAVVRMSVSSMAVSVAVTVIVAMAVVMIAVVMPMVVGVFLLGFEAHELQNVEIVESEDSNEIDSKAEAGDEEQTISSHGWRGPHTDERVCKDAEGDETKENAVQISGEDFDASKAE